MSLLRGCCAVVLGFGLIAASASACAADFPEISSTGSIDALAFSADGKWLAVGTSKGFVAVWDLNTKKPAHAWEPKQTDNNWVRQIAFAPAKGQIAVAQAAALHLHPLPKSPKSLSVAGAHDLHCTSAAYSPSGKLLVTGGYDGVVRAWGPTGKIQHECVPGKFYRADGGAIHRVVAIDDRLVAACHFDHVVRLWDVPARKLVKELKHPNPVSDGVVTRDRKRLVTTSNDRQTRVWDLERLEQIHTVQAPATRIARAALGDQTVVLDARAWSLIDPVAAKVLHTKKHADPKTVWNSVAVSPDGTTVALGDSSGRVTFESVVTTSVP